MAAFPETPSETRTFELIARIRDEDPEAWSELYRLYRQLHDAFGTTGYQGGLDRVMKDLIAIRNRVRKGQS